MIRLVVVGVLTAIGVAMSAGVATAQETEPEPEINCFPLLSSLVCYLPITVGPFDITVPVDVGSVFPPTPS